MVDARTCCQQGNGQPGCRHNAAGECQTRRDRCRLRRSLNERTQRDTSAPVIAEALCEPIADRFATAMQTLAHRCFLQVDLRRDRGHRQALLVAQHQDRARGLRQRQQRVTDQPLDLQRRDEVGGGGLRFWRQQAAPGTGAARSFAMQEPGEIACCAAQPMPEAVCERRALQRCQPGRLYHVVDVLSPHQGADEAPQPVRVAQQFGEFALGSVHGD